MFFLSNIQSSFTIKMRQILIFIGTSKNNKTEILFSKGRFLQYVNETNVGRKRRFIWRLFGKRKCNTQCFMSTSFAKDWNNIPLPLSERLLITFRDTIKVPVLAGTNHWMFQTGKQHHFSDKKLRLTVLPDHVPLFALLAVPAHQRLLFHQKG